MGAFRLNVEKVLRGGLDAIVEIAVIDGIHVHLHDLPLWVLLCDAVSQQSLLAFDLECPGLIQEKLVLDELLGNRASPFNNRMVLYVGERSAQRTLYINALIVPEGMIFRSYGRLHQVLRDFIVVHIGAPTIIWVV